MSRINVMLSYFEHENKTGGINAKDSCFLKKKKKHDPAVNLIFINFEVTGNVPSQSIKILLACIFCR